MVGHAFPSIFLLAVMRTVLPGVFLLLCLFRDVGSVICRSCNLSVPFHGCLLDFGTCKTKPGQYCIKETHVKGGIKWFTVKGCTEDVSECSKLKNINLYETHSTLCCRQPLCNF